jgi:hypothetical protein
MKCTYKVTTDDEKRLPVFARDEWRWLWHSDYYDGPRSGLILCNDEKFYIVCYDDGIIRNGEMQDSGYSDVWKYAVYKLTPEKLEYEERWHKLFFDLVGQHTTYNEKGTQLMPNDIKQKPDWAAYYLEFDAEYEDFDLADPTVAELVGFVEY